MKLWIFTVLFLMVSAGPMIEFCDKEFPVISDFVQEVFGHNIKNINDWPTDSSETNETEEEKDAEYYYSDHKGKPFILDSNNRRSPKFLISKGPGRSVPNPPPEIQVL